MRYQFEVMRYQFEMLKNLLEDKSRPELDSMAGIRWTVNIVRRAQELGFQDNHLGDVFTAYYHVKQWVDKRLFQLMMEEPEW